MIEVEIWSDIACPWCYVGKRRFEAALARFEHRDQVRVLWRSFELDPAAPPERQGDRARRLAEKYAITVERAKEIEAHLRDVAAADGLQLCFESVRSGSTLDAHRLVHLAADNGLQDAMKERLLRAHFTDGDLVSDHETLVRLALEVGLEERAAREMLADDSYLAEVRDEERLAAELGLSGVPSFVVDRSIGVSGAHAPDALLELLREGWRRGHASAAEQLLAGDGAACGTGGCESS